MVPWDELGKDYRFLNLAFDITSSESNKKNLNIAENPASLLVNGDGKS
jgi:hypothetical protein